MLKFKDYFIELPQEQIDVKLLFKLNNYKQLLLLNKISPRCLQYYVTSQQIKVPSIQDLQDAIAQHNIDEVINLEPLWS